MPLLPVFAHRGEDPFSRRREMFEPINSSGMGSDAACQWCGRALTQGDRRVCQRCLRMLRDAGIPEEEIFGSAESYSGKKRLPGAKSNGRANKFGPGLGISK
jgi:hypothetical protein